MKKISVEKPPVFDKKQAEAMAKWWSNVFDKYLPTIIALKNSLPKVAIFQTPEQKERFLKILADEIFLRAKEYDVNFKIAYNGENWDLVMGVLEKLDIALQIDEQICGLISIMYLNRTLSFQPYTKPEFYKIDKPDVSLLMPPLLPENILFASDPRDSDTDSDDDSSLSELAEEKETPPINLQTDSSMDKDSPKVVLRLLTEANQNLKQEKSPTITQASASVAEEAILSRGPDVTLTNKSSMEEVFKLPARKCLKETDEAFMELCSLSPEPTTQEKEELLLLLQSFELMKDQVTKKLHAKIELRQVSPPVSVAKIEAIMKTDVLPAEENKATVVTKSVTVASESSQSFLNPAQRLKQDKPRLIAKDENSQCIIINAIMNRQSIKTIDELIGFSKKYLESQDDEGNNLAHIACLANRCDVLNLLWTKYHFDFEKCNHAKLTPLTFALMICDNGNSMACITVLQDAQQGQGSSLSSIAQPF